MNTLKLGTIEEEVAACRKRWKDFGVGVVALAAHIHHDTPFERLCYPAEERIAYILKEKPEDERALRLRCFAPLDLTKFSKWRKASAVWRKASAAWEQTLAELLKVRVKSGKTSAAYRKAETALWKAGAALRKAEVVLQKICDRIPHTELCPLGSDCPWDGETIFSN
jgi:hypothetical protein